MLKFCPNCSEETEIKNGYCTECGEELYEPPKKMESSGWDENDFEDSDFSESEWDQFYRYGGDD